MRDKSIGGICEALLYPDIRIFTRYEKLDSIAVGLRFVENVEQMLTSFKHFSKEKCFNCLQLEIKELDKTKNKQKQMFPNWFNPKEWHTINQILSAFLEQVLIKKFAFCLREEIRILINPFNELLQHNRILTQYWIRCSNEEKLKVIFYL